MESLGVLLGQKVRQIVRGGGEVGRSSKTMQLRGRKGVKVKGRDSPRGGKLRELIWSRLI